MILLEAKVKSVIQASIFVAALVVLCIVVGTIIVPWIEDLDIEREFQLGWGLYLETKYCEAIAPLSNATQRSSVRSRIPRYPFALAVNYAMIRGGELPCSPYQPDVLDDMVLRYYDLAGNWALEKQDSSYIPELLDALCKRNVDHYRALLESLKRRGRSEGNIEACLKVRPAASPTSTLKPTSVVTTNPPTSTVSPTPTLESAKPTARLHLCLCHRRFSSGPLQIIRRADCAKG